MKDALIPIPILIVPLACIGAALYITLRYVYLQPTLETGSDILRRMSTISWGNREPLPPLNIPLQEIEEHARTPGDLRTAPV